MAGLATIEDVIEQIVGDIDDEHDPEEAEFIQDHGDGRFTVLALTRIEDFGERFGVELSAAEFDTVGGLIMHELGRLPRRGDVLEFAGFRFCVKVADRRADSFPGGHDGAGSRCPVVLGGRGRPVKYAG